jgi:hypothetical protein
VRSRSSGSCCCCIGIGLLALVLRHDPARRGLRDRRLRLAGLQDRAADLHRRRGAGAVSATRRGGVPGRDALGGDRAAAGGRLHLPPRPARHRRARARRADAGPRGVARGGTVEIARGSAASSRSSPRSTARASQPSTTPARAPWC